MTTQSARPPDTASRVWITLHEFTTGRERRVAFCAALSIFDRRLRSPDNCIHQT